VRWSDWMEIIWERRPAPPSDPGASADTPQPPKHRVSGKYSSLYTYLEKRYADTVVLTFDQIESLLGFPLPDGARTQGEWWTRAGDSTPNAGDYCDAWILAGRTATPNLLARTVHFERVPS
jgi:hypothetical protein